MPEWKTSAKYLLLATRNSERNETLSYKAGDVIGVADNKHGVYHEGRKGPSEGWIMWEEDWVIRGGVIGACNKLSEIIANNKQRHSLRDVGPTVTKDVLLPLQGVFMQNHAMLGRVLTSKLEDLLLQMSLAIISVTKSKYSVKKKYLVRSMRHIHKKLKHEVAQLALRVASEEKPAPLGPASITRLVRSPTVPLAMPVPREQSVPCTEVEVQTTPQHTSTALYEVPQEPCWKAPPNKDPTQAAPMWRLAADAGCPDSMVELGKLCETGSEPSREDAALWYRYASERESSEGKYRLALLLLSYDSDDKKLVHEAEELLAQAATGFKGHPQAAVHLGWLYESSIVPSRKPLSNALRWYKLAAHYGSLEAHAHMAYCLIVKGHYLNAVDCVQHAVQHNEPEGLHVMGMMYLHALGVPKEPKTARRLFKKASQQGHSGSMQQMGNYYYTCNKLPEAIVAYKKAALLGEPEACRGLAVISDAREQEYWERRAYKIKELYHRWSTPVLESFVS